MAAGKNSARSWLLGTLGALSVGFLVALAILDQGGRASILLISIDTLRADHLGGYGYRRATSPFIDSVAAAGSLFENAMVPLPATDPSHASLLTSLHPIRHGLHTNGMRLAAEAETMAEVLSGQGYHTMGATAVVHLSRDYGFDQGFDDFSDERKRHSRPASEVNASVGAMLEAHARERRDVPFFLFVHYFDAHSPYQMRSRYAPAEPLPERQPLLGAGDRERIEAYDSEVRFVDGHIERLVGQIDALGLGRKLLVCIVSDHGEQFGEHGFSGGHSDFYRETVRVPIICRGPGIPHRRVDRVVSSMDLAPSLLQRVGAKFSRAVDGSPDMLAETTPATRSRNLLVLGYPSYTRSLQVIDDPWVFIRNLEEVYRNVRVEPLARVDGGLLAREGFREARPLSSSGAEVAYPMPEIDFDPYAITAVVQKAEAGCDVSVKIRLEPRLWFLPEPIHLSGALRVTYPVSRFDRTSIVLSSRCAGPVFFKYARLGEEGLRGETVVSAVFGALRTPRKDSTASEVFDFRTDPGMLNNLIDSPEGRATTNALGRKLLAMYTEHRKGAVRTDDSRDYTPAELEMLRALGYVQ